MKCDNCGHFGYEHVGPVHCVDTLGREANWCDGDLECPCPGYNTGSHESTGLES